MKDRKQLAQSGYGRLDSAFCKGEINEYQAVVYGE